MILLKSRTSFTIGSVTCLMVDNKMLNSSQIFKLKLYFTLLSFIDCANIAFHSSNTRRKENIKAFNNLTHPSVDAVTIATFPSSLRLAAAVELILIALKVPENVPQHRSVMFQAFCLFARSRDWKEPTSRAPDYPLLKCIFYPNLTTSQRKHLASNRTM